MVLQTKSTVILILASFTLLIGCSKDKAISTLSLNYEDLPTVHTEGVTSLISDSGVTRYRVETKVWDIYSNAPEPYWHFPEGAYVEQFDSVFNVVGSIKADTVYFFERKELWQLIGNVFIKNLEGHTFETSELFWNQKEPPDSEEAVYTDKTVRIDQGNDVTATQGLRANQSLTKLRLMNVGANIWVKDEALTPADRTETTEAQKDSIP